jgi:hypothetical protein
MRVVALRHLVEKDQGYRPGDTIKEDTELFRQREYYAKAGMVRIEDPLAPVAKVVGSVTDFPDEALQKAREAAANILGGTKKGRPKKAGDGVVLSIPEGEDDD